MARNVSMPHYPTPNLGGHHHGRGAQDPEDPYNVVDPLPKQGKVQGLDRHHKAGLGTLEVQGGVIVNEWGMVVATVHPGESIEDAIMRATGMSMSG